MSRLAGIPINSEEGYNAAMDALKNAALQAAWKKFQTRLAVVQKKITRQGRARDQREKQDKVSDIQKRLREL